MPYWFSEIMKNERLPISFNRYDELFDRDYMGKVKEEKKMKFKVGDKVRLRKDLVVGKKYGALTFIESMNVNFDKTFRISFIDDRDNTCKLEGSYHNFFYSMEMLELAEFTKDDLQVNDIITIREGDMLIIHEFDGELFGINNDDYNEIAEYDINLKDIDGCADVDIVSVRRPEEPWHLEQRCWGKAPIIWQENKEPYGGKPFSELFEQQWNWLANNPEKNKEDWFKAFYPKEERPSSDCFACQSALHNGIADCEKCPICDWKGTACLNGLYDAWWLARGKGEFGITRAVAMAIANLKWEDKNGKE